MDWLFSPGDTIPVVKFPYKQPIIFEYLAAAWIVIPISLIGVLIFWLQAESSEEDYVEYLFADYVVSVASEAEDISFDEDTTLAVSAQLDSDIATASLSTAEDDIDQESISEDSGDANQADETPTETGDPNSDENSSDDTTDVE